MYSIVDETVQINNVCTEGFLQVQEHKYLQFDSYTVSLTYKEKAGGPGI